MKVADRVDDLKDEIRTVAKEAKSTSGITEQIDAVSYTHLTLPTNREV